MTGVQTCALPIWRDVVTTVANGKVLMKDRELLHIDADKVMADCRQAAKELADRING